MARIGPRLKSPHKLTSREQEVLELVRLGLTNEEIAGRLGISANGVKYHVSEILSKLGVSSREEAAAWRPEERVWWRVLAPLTLVKAAGVAFALAAVAGLGLLAWGLLEDGGSAEAVCAAGSTDQFEQAQRRAWFDVYCPTALPEGFELDFATYAPDLDKVPESETPPPNTGSLTVVFVNESGARIDFFEGNLGGDLFPVWRQYPPPEPSDVRFGDAFDALLYPSYEAGEFGTQPAVVWAQQSGLPQYVIIAEGVDEAALRTVSGSMAPVGDTESPIVTPSQQPASPTSTTLMATPFQTIPPVARTTSEGVWTIRADGTGLQLIEEGFVRSSLPSSDGRIAISPFCEWPAAISIVTLDGATETVLDGFESLVTETSWDPTDRRLLVSELSPAHPQTPLVYLADLDGSAEPRPLFEGFPATWSPDGEAVFYLAPANDGSELHIFNLADDSDILIQAGPISRVTWSPDGDRLAYSVSLDLEPGIYVTDRNGNRDRILNGYTLLGWSPEGNGLYVRRALPPSGKQVEIGVASLNGTVEVVLETASGSFTISPDGSLALVYRNLEGGLTALYSVNLADGSERVISGGVAPSGEFALSPDGEIVAFVGVELETADGRIVSGTSPNLYTVATDGSGLRKLVAPSLATALRGWSVDGEWIIFHDTRITGCEEPFGSGE